MIAGSRRQNVMLDLGLAIAAPLAPELRQVRACLHAELTLFLLLPIFAALMARGYGEF